MSSAVAAVREGGIRPILVGPLDILEQELGKAEKDVVNSIKTEFVKVNSYMNMEKK